MITWTTFIYFAIPAVALSLGAAVTSLCANDHWAASSSVYRRRRVTALALSFASLAVLAGFIVGLWISLGRPPMRTMGETRLWYSFFALLSGLLTYLLWRPHEITDVTLLVLHGCQGVLRLGDCDMILCAGE